MIGAGSHAKSVLAALKECGMKCVGIFDDDESLRGKSVWEIPVLGPVSDMPDTEEIMAVIAIGDNGVRKEIYSKFKNVCWPVVIHPTAAVNSSVGIGEGSVILERAVIQADSKIGKQVIVNAGALLSHDVTVCNYCHLALGVCVGNNVLLHEGAFLGIGTVVIPNIKVGEFVTVGAGSTVIKDLDSKGMYVGSPAHRIMRPVVREEQLNAAGALEHAESDCKHSN